MALRCHVNIKRNSVVAIIDTEATISIMIKKLMNKLGLVIQESSQVIIITANGQRERALGVIKNVPLVIHGILIKTTFQIIESTDETLLLGIDWCKKNKVNVDFDNNEMLITCSLDKAIVLVQCIVGNRIPTIVFDEEIDQLIDEELEYDTEDDVEERESFHIGTESYQDDSDSDNETSSQSWADEVEAYEREILQQDEVKNPKYVLNILYDQD